MAKVDYDLQTDGTELTFPEPVGDGTWEAFILSETGQEVAMMAREHLSKLIDTFGYIEDEQEFPGSFNRLNTIAFDAPGDFFRVYESDLDAEFGLDPEKLEMGIRIASGGSRFEPSHFTLYRPTRFPSEQFSPFILETDYTPIEWVLYGMFDGLEGFCETFEVGEDEVGIKRAACSDRVNDYLEQIMDEHPGVLVMLAPRVANPGEENEINREDQVDMEEAIDAYVERTGDELLANEESLDQFLEHKGVL